MDHRNQLRLGLAVVLAALWLLAFAGCGYHVPFTERISEGRRVKMVARERCARSHDWQVWELYLHSLHS